MLRGPAIRVDAVVLPRITQSRHRDCWGSTNGCYQHLVRKQLKLSRGFFGLQLLRLCVLCAGLRCRSGLHPLIVLLDDLTEQAV